VRAALVRLSAVGALAAAVLGARQTWPDLGHARAHLTAAQAETAAAAHEQLPIGLFERWRAQLHRDDRWWLEVPAGAPEGLTNRGAVYRAFAVYFFLPALPAGSAKDATVVFHLREPR
jgi:hypothetical protein